MTDDDIDLLDSKIAKLFITSFARPSYQENPEQPTQGTSEKTSDMTSDKTLSTIEKDIFSIDRGKSVRYPEGFSRAIES
jgi:hypothetical protein